MMTFELLPNELLLCCFNYLNAPDIFYSFDQLTSRFNKLIENIPLHVNFQNIRKSTFTQFCMKMLLNPEIKNQIHSFRLSNDGTCDQIQAFISFFSLIEFNSLRSLTLIKVEKNDMDQLKSMLPLIPNLFYIHLIDPDEDVYGRLSRRKRSLPTSTKALICCLPPILEISLLTNLTIRGCSCRDLSQLFENAPMLKYLNAEYIASHCSWTNYETDSSNHCAIYLKTLILTSFYQDFKTFEMLMKQTPNLKSLTFEFDRFRNIIGAHPWKNLITTLLPQLTILKLVFTYIYLRDVNVILDKVKAFQTDFWQEQHHSSTEYSLNGQRIKIYTIFHMSHPSAVYLQNELNIGNTVTTLTVHHKDVIKQCQQYFPNVTRLELERSYSEPNNDGNILLGEEYFQSLKMIVNLSNLEYLGVVSVPKMNISFLLLHILQETPKLSSLSITLDSIILIFSNDEICKYLNTMIKKLSIYDGEKLFSNNDITEKFCKIFSNIEQFSCSMKDPYCLFVLLERLSNLSIMKASIFTRPSPLDLSLFEDEIRKLNVLFRIECTKSGREENDDVGYSTSITIWNDNNKQ